ncbi:MAG TPA: hypothetical protein VG936_15565 [Lacunisphaera sp.]|nr:hypothetical protein [Lacunisphaera sp.]
MCRSIAVLLVLFFTAGAWAQIEDLKPRGWLHLNGYTDHFDAPNANDELYGLGFTWYTKSAGHTERAWEGDVFRDSGNKLSAYAGHSWIYATRHWKAGLLAGLMYHRNFIKEDRWCLLPIALPFMELPLRAFSIRAYYVPPVRSRHDHQIAFQLLLPSVR